MDYLNDSLCFSDEFALAVYSIALEAAQWGWDRGYVNIIGLGPDFTNMLLMGGEMG